MRIWDIDPGFLNAPSLLGEHRELHGLFSIHMNHKKGYSRHPETLRWKTALTGLFQRHEILVREMQLRGMNHKSPLEKPGGTLVWPESWIDLPHVQFGLLRAKYEGKPHGRIPLPDNCQNLWAFHKYSVMARDPGLYKQIGPAVARNNIRFDDLALLVTGLLRQPPAVGRMRNVLDHMWGYVSGFSRLWPETLDLAAQFKEIQVLSLDYDITYLIASTALSEIGAWI
ncbi:MAG: DUF1722 domain-containing protein [Desulfobacter sp.]|nr:DUF1722 domain-containing protein [Desulfobacter sp.]WDP84743.1 MAG: DUF1722 domain-containing protein [Desulfobacter sp.]